MINRHQDYIINIYALILCTSQSASNLIIQDSRVLELDTRFQKCYTLVALPARSMHQSSLPGHTIEERLRSLFFAL